MVRWLIYSLLGLLLLSACAAPNALVSPEGARPVTEEEAFASPLSPLPEPEITSPLPERVGFASVYTHGCAGHESDGPRGSARWQPPGDRSSDPQCG
jgi:hypothetical protein